MKIGIDARMYGTKQRGLGRYVQKLVDGLVKTDTTNEYYVFLTSENIELLKTNNHRVKKILFNARWYGFKEQTVGALLLNKYKVDLIHFPHFNVPINYQRKFIVTIHDLIIKHYPNSRATTLPRWQYKIKLMAFDLVLKHALQKSYKIIAPSQFVKDDILKNYKLPVEKIEVIYEGYFLDGGHQIADISRLNIKKKFLLYVGSAYPHKNLEKLVRVFQKINQAKKYQLVLVGEVDYFYQRLKKEVGEVADVIYTGYVSEGELSGLYRQALAYVFPSLFEGFGLPPLEAQAHGVPVVSANSSSLPEILGDSAVYFNPQDEAEMFKKIQLVLQNENLRQQLIKAGSENIKRFSWERMATQTLSLYTNI